MNHVEIKSVLSRLREMEPSMNATQLEGLVTIAVLHGCRSTILAEHCDLSAMQLSRIIRFLESHGLVLVERGISSDNQRAPMIRITAKGKRYLAQLAAV